MSNPNDRALNDPLSGQLIGQVEVHLNTPPATKSSFLLRFEQISKKIRIGITLDKTTA